MQLCHLCVSCCPGCLTVQDVTLGRNHGNLKTNRGLPFCIQIQWFDQVLFKNSVDNYHAVDDSAFCPACVKTARVVGSRTVMRCVKTNLICLHHCRWLKAVWIYQIINMSDTFLFKIFGYIIRDTICWFCCHMLSGNCCCDPMSHGMTLCDPMDDDIPTSSILGIAVGWADVHHAYNYEASPYLYCSGYRLGRHRPPDNYQTTYDSKNKIVVFYSLICFSSI